MARNGCWLRPNWKTKIPTRHLCVATTVRPARSSLDVLELAGAALVAADWSAGQWQQSASAVAVTAPELWAHVKAALPAAGKTWLWFLCPRQDFPALEFNRLVECQTFRRNYWVWADPPVIVDGFLWGRGVRMVGLENWLSAQVCPAVAGCSDDGSSFDPGTGTDYPMAVNCAALELAATVGKLLRVVHREDLGHLRSTVGGQAMQAYRHQFITREVKVGVHNNQPALALERMAPLGFPVDCRRSGIMPEPITVLDVNALYPHVMGNYPYPRHLLWYSESVDLEGVRRQSESALMIVRANLVDPGRRYLVRHDDGCRWHTGPMTCVLVGPDFDRALTRGVITQVHAAAAYEGAGLFVQWSEWVWALRQRYRRENDPIGKSAAKMLSVALWGQFSRRLETYVGDNSVPAPHPYGKFLHHDADAGTVHVCRAIAGIVDRLECRAEPSDSMPSVSAFVAAYARSYMAGLAAIAGEENVVYQVADALHVTEAGRTRLERAGLVDPEVMGRLKVTREVLCAEYSAPNVFLHDGQLTVAGVPETAVAVGPGEFAWRSPARLEQSIMVPPSGRIRAPLRWHSLQRPGRERVETHQGLPG